MKKVILILVLIGLLFTSQSIFAATLQYKIEKICPAETMGKNMSLNNNGQVAGEARGGGAYLYSNGTVTYISSQYDAAAYGINDSGKVTGYFDTGYSHKVFTYESGVFTDLGSYGGLNAQGRDINNNGLIAGYRDITLGYSNAHAVIYEGSNYTELCSGCAMAINDAGQVVGMHYTGHPYPSAPFLYSNGTVIDLTPANSGSAAYGINQLGHVAGDSYCQAFLWKDGNIQYLGTLGGQSYAFGLNDLDQVVGTCFGFADQGQKAFIWSEGTMYDLTSLLPADSQWTSLISAFEINNKGQIAGYGSIAGDFQQYAFLMTPIPEPASAILIGAGFFFARLRRKQN